MGLSGASAPRLRLRLAVIVYAPHEVFMLHLNTLDDISLHWYALEHEELYIGVRR